MMMMLDESCFSHSRNAILHCDTVNFIARSTSQTGSKRRVTSHTCWALHILESCLENSDINTGFRSIIVFLISWAAHSFTWESSWFLASDTLSTSRIDDVAGRICQDAHVVLVEIISFLAFLESNTLTIDESETRKTIFAKTKIINSQTVVGNLEANTIDTPLIFSAFGFFNAKTSVKLFKSL